MKRKGRRAAAAVAATAVAFSTLLISPIASVAADGSTFPYNGPAFSLPGTSAVSSIRWTDYAGKTLYCVNLGQLSLDNDGSYESAASREYGEGQYRRVSNAKVTGFSDLAFNTLMQRAKSDNKLKGLLAAATHVIYENENVPRNDGQGAYTPEQRADILWSKLTPAQQNDIRTTLANAQASLPDAQGLRAGTVDSKPMKATLKGQGFKRVNGANAFGNGFDPSVKVTLDGPAVFAANGQKSISVPASQVSDLEMTIKGSGTVRYVVEGEYPFTPGFKVYEPQDKAGYQDMITLNDDGPGKNTKFKQRGEFEAIFLTNIGVEKAFSYSPEGGVKMVDDADANAASKLDKVAFALYRGGQPVMWDDADVIVDETKSSGSRDGAQPARYKVGDQVVTERPASGPVEVWADAEGEAYFMSIVDNGEYEIREISAPAELMQDDDQAGPKSVTFNTRNDQAVATDDRGVKTFERVLGEEDHADKGDADTGIVNEFRKFRFQAQKYFGISTGSDSADGKTYLFGDEGQAALDELGQATYDDVEYELRYSNDNPVMWEDNVMHFVKKDPAHYVESGSFSSTTGAVKIKPDSNTGEVKAFGFLSADQDQFQLVEVAKTDRSHDHVAGINIDATVDNYNVNTLTSKDTSSDKSQINNIDWTGIKMTKKGNYLGTTYGPTDNPNIGQADFNDTVYGLFYGAGPKKDQPVMSGDWQFDIVKQVPNAIQDFNIDANGQIKWNSKNGVVDIQIKWLPFGSYYVQELKAGEGHHIDPTRYYFGDKIEMPEGSVYADTTDLPAQTRDDKSESSAAKVSTAVSTDDVKLISAELEKQEQYLGVESPFMRGTSPKYGQGNKPTYSFGDVTDSRIRDGQLFGESEVNELGKTVRSGNVYGLFYHQATDDGQGVKETPVKWSDRVVEHMQITAGTRIPGDEIRISTSDEPDTYGRIAVTDIAYGSYYWKEIETQPGLVLDPKEYVFGASRSAESGNGDKGNYAGTTDKNVPYDVTQIVTQTTAAPSKANTKTNWSWKNTFDDGRNAGSTDTVVTFGFSSVKIAEDSDRIGDDGENGVKLTLTPINGTKGDKIETETFKQVFIDNAGKTVSRDGYFEFRTVPYGEYLMTSDGTSSDKADSIVKLLEISPIIVSMNRVEDGNYVISFVQDTDEDGKVSDEDIKLSEFNSKDLPNIPTQADLNALNAVDTVDDSLEKGGKEYLGEPHPWTRDGWKDVNTDGTKNNNFISGEVNIDNSGFEVKDIIKPETELEVGTNLVDKSDSDQVVPANKTDVELIDTVGFINKGEIKPNETLTIRNVMVDPKSEKELTAPQCKVVTAPEKPETWTEDVEITFNTMDMHGKSAVAYERVYRGEVEKCEHPDETKTPLIGRHEDPKDPKQTVKIQHEGKIKTKATDGVDGDKNVAADKNQLIKDVIDVTDSNLQPGHVYTVKASPVIPFVDGIASGAPIPFTELPARVEKPTIVIDQNNQRAIALPYESISVIRDSNVAVKVKENGIVSDRMLKSNEFVYTEGVTEVAVTVSGVDLTNFRPLQKVVMFEDVRSDDITPLIHADINDTDQTVTVESILRTNLFNKADNTQTYKPGEKVQLIDKIQARGVDAKGCYIAKGELMEKASSAEADKADGIEDGMMSYKDASGNPVVSEREICLEKSNADFNVPFNFESAKRDVDIVAYETLAHKDDPSKVLIHKDPKDKKQTVTPVKTPEKPEAPAKAKLSKLAKTGLAVGGGLAAAAAAGFAGVGFLRARRRSH